MARVPVRSCWNLEGKVIVFFFIFLTRGSFRSLHIKTKCHQQLTVMAEIYLPVSTIGSLITGKLIMRKWFTNEISLKDGHQYLKSISKCSCSLIVNVVACFFEFFGHINTELLHWPDSELRFLFLFLAGLVIVSSILLMLVVKSLHFFSF